jgi:protein arginine N-methyltransferase 2
MTEDVDSDMQVQMILLAAAHHNLEDLRPLLRQGSASAQDPETGYTPLHAAIAACAPEDGHTENETNRPRNGQLEEQTASEDLEAAVKTVKLLLQNGAIWNDLDNNNETPGCLAYRLGLNELYELMVDAGVRAELLLTHLDEYQRLEQSAEEDDDEDTNESGAPEAELGTTEQTNVEVNSEDYLRSELTFRGDRLLDVDA